MMTEGKQEEPEQNSQFEEAPLCPIIADGLHVLHTFNLAWAILSAMMIWAMVGVWLPILQNNDSGINVLTATSTCMRL